MKQPDTNELTPKRTSIGTENESSLHALLKDWYSQPGDKQEEKVDGFIIDIVRENTLIEIQTANFSAIGRKIRKLVKTHKLTLVYPIAVEKWIVKQDAQTYEIISRKKSPKKGTITDLFNELIRIPDLIGHENLIIEVPLIKLEESRCDDGRGSYRRKGVSIIDKKLLEVVACIQFKEKKDFSALLPDNLQADFTNKDLADAIGIRMNQAQKMTYCLKKSGLLKETGKLGNRLVFERI